MKTPLQSKKLRSENNWSQEQLVRKLARVILLGSVLPVFYLVNIFGVAEGADFCQKTSQTALSSCQAGAQSDKLLAIGKCDNLSDAAARAECKTQASADRKDARQTCQDQFDARQAVCDRLGPAPYDPVIDPANFVAIIDNPFFSLTPGTTFIYESATEHDEFFVTHNTKMILGVTCIEVHDTSTVGGQLTEDTFDWFAQDKDGNVWYFGENSRQLVGGVIVGVEGSWTAGVDGAKPGIIMEAHPAVGDFYRQEFALGTAEDVGKVLSLSESVTVPAGSFNNCLKTKDTSPLEPDVVENKFYCPGKGDVLEIDLTSGERLELKGITTGG